ncbi:hypothetical protein ACFSX9_05380 [Flavobacterium ardleyense]|uniref:Uncharacterized protein n=1 Tax=Flavobacterium ardleyense TaxID=2038737 RepID=A0ABW5Z7V9_9FLAO
MKKITTIAVAFLLFTGATMNAQTALKKGSVTYKMEITGDNEANAMMGESTMSVHFNETMQATDVNMMGGMMLMKTITPLGNFKDSKMSVEAMGMKYEIIEISDEALEANKGVGNVDDALEIKYDKKDTKEIAGFKCYKAIVKMKDGTSNDFYITEGIASQGSKDAKLKLAGYPLQLTTSTPNGEVTMTATSFSKELPKDCFSVGEGFTKVTMEEFQKQMGGM